MTDPKTLKVAQYVLDRESTHWDGAVMVARALVERETPVKVAGTGFDEIYAMWFKCSKCKCEHILSSFKFCPKCGTRLEWE